MASVNIHKGRLYLLAKLPRRDGQPGVSQTRIALKLDDTPVNRRVAAKQLQTLERQLDTGTFEWSYWLDEDSAGLTWRVTRGGAPRHGRREASGSNNARSGRWHIDLSSAPWAALPQGMQKAAPIRHGQFSSAA